MVVVDGTHSYDGVRLDASGRLVNWEARRIHQTKPNCLMNATSKPTEASE